MLPFCVDNFYLEYFRKKKSVARGGPSTSICVLKDNQFSIAIVFIKDIRNPSWLMEWND